MNTSIPAERTSRRIIEFLIPITVLAILLVYSYARFFLISYNGFQFNGSTGEVSEISVNQSAPPFLEAGDILIAVNGVDWTRIQESQQENPLAHIQPGETVSLEVQGADGPRHIEWKATGFNMPEFWARLINTWPLSYVFWLAGTATLLLVRPKNERWTLLIAFYYVTAIWFIAGGVSSWRVLESSLVLRIGVWASLPIYLHLHWNFPSLIRPIWRGWIFLLYGVCVALGLAQAVGWLGRNAHALGLVIAVAISVLLLLGRLIWRSTERRDVGFLFLATAVALAPVIAVALTSSQSSTDPALPGLLFSMVALPGAYFFVVYRRQLGGLELRANRLISLYLFAVLLVTIALVLFPIFSATTGGLEAASGAIVLTALATTLVTSLGFSPFQRFVERRLLRIPQTPDHLLSEFASEISTSISYEHLAEVLKSKVLPTLLIRESALVDFEEGNDSSQVVYQNGVSRSELPSADELARMKKLVNTSDDHGISVSSWVRFALPLRVANSIRGLWLLGRKDPDDYYHQNERSLLSSLADQMAIALTNISQAKSLRALHRADIERQEAERIHLAQELHDDVLPTINQLEDSQGKSGSIIAKIDQLNEQVRRLMAGLRPPLLDQGLYLAIEQLVEDLRDKHPGPAQIKFEVAANLVRFEPSVEQHIFRIVQQASENAFAHGQPMAVTISGKINEGGAYLSVEDDGKGFELQGTDLSALLKTRHFGLASMSERAAMIDAALDITSTPSRGTKVKVTWSPEQ